MIINEYKNTDGIDCITIKNEDGSIWSGLKSVYETSSPIEGAQ